VKLTLAFSIIILGIFLLVHSGVARGELVSFDNTNVEVMLVDQGGVSKMGRDGLYPIPIDMMRIPKLVIPCRVAYLRPEEPTWPELEIVDYSKDFSGECQIIYFQDFYEATRSFETILEVDGVNIGIKYLHAGIARGVDLPIITDSVLNGKYFVLSY